MAGGEEYRHLAEQARRLAASILVLTAGFGCSRTPEPLYPVTGTVQVGGQRMTSGTVQFEMIEVGGSGKRYTSSSTIDSQGRFRLRTFDQDGAPAGRHRVWVVPNFAALPDKIGQGVDRISPVPRKYMLPTTTDLEYTVEEGENTIEVNVPGK
jgi:hypothetical protein